MLDFVKAFHDAFRGATWLFFLAVAVGFACVGLLLAWMVHNSIEKREAEEQQSSVLSRQLTVEWHMVYPAAIPPEGRAAVLELFELPQSNGGGGLGEISGKPGGDFAGKTAEGFARTVKQYRITNYSPKTLFNVHIALHLVFKEAIRRKDQPNSMDSGKVVVDRDWGITIPKIDPGYDRAFVFYAMNSGNCFASVSFPNTATAQLKLVDGRIYGGHLFHTYQISESADMVELVFTGIEWATFKAEELQEFAQDCIRLHPRLPK
jgi:hypothetical protein